MFLIFFFFSPCGPNSGLRFNRLIIHVIYFYFIPLLYFHFVALTHKNKTNSLLSDFFLKQKLTPYRHSSRHLYLFPSLPRFYSFSSSFSLPHRPKYLHFYFIFTRFFFSVLSKCFFLCVILFFFHFIFRRSSFFVHGKKKK